jgi:hypothetical protein
MSFPRGSFARMSVAALLAPLGPALCVLPVLEAWRRDTQRDWVFRDTGEFLLAWLALSLFISVVGLLLRAWNKTALRHHLLTTLIIGAVPLLLTVVHWLLSMNWSGHPEVVAMPYPCHELLRSGTFDLPGKVTLALLVSTAGVAFKWLAYGFDADHKPGAGWQTTGVVTCLRCCWISAARVGSYCD